MECVDVSDDLTFGDIEANAGPRAKLLDYVQKGYHVLYGVCGECAIVSVPFASKFEPTKRNFKSLIYGSELAEKRFDHEVEKKRRQGGRLEGSPV